LAKLGGRRYSRPLFAVLLRDSPTFAEYPRIGWKNTRFDMYESGPYGRSTSTPPPHAWARMADARSLPSWGKGRTVFVSRLETIRSEISEGLLLTTIYGRHKEALGIGYAGFCKLVARYADDAKPLRPRAAPLVAQAASPALPASPVPLTPEARPDARHEPAARADFKHHGIVQEGEPEQLFGPGFLPKRGG